MNMKKIKIIYIIEILLYSLLLTPLVFRSLNLNHLNVLILSIVLLFVSKKIHNFKFKDYYMKKVKLKDFNFIFIILSLLFPIALIGRLLDPNLDFIYAEAFNFSNLNLIGILIFLALTVIIVLKESIILRGLLQSNINKYYGKLTTSILIAIYFGLVHYLFSIQRVSILFGVIVATFILAWFFEIIKNFWVISLTHLFYNFIILLQIYLHFTNNLILEVLLWLVWGLAFLFNLKKFKKYLKFKEKAVFYTRDLVFVILFLSLPFLFLL